MRRLVLATSMTTLFACNAVLGNHDGDFVPAGMSGASGQGGSAAGQGGSAAGAPTGGTGGMAKGGSGGAGKSGSSNAGGKGGTGGVGGNSGASGKSGAAGLGGAGGSGGVGGSSGLGGSGGAGAGGTGGAGGTSGASGAAGIGGASGNAGSSGSGGTSGSSGASGSGGVSGSSGGVSGSSGASGNAGSSGMGGSGGSSGAGGGCAMTTSPNVPPDGTCPAANATDAQNCGAPGHDCLGANCAGCFCDVTTIVTGQGSIKDLDVDATDVWYTTSLDCTQTASVRHLAKDAVGGTPIVFDPAAPGVFSIIVGSANVYYGSSGSLLAVDKLAGPPGTPLGTTGIGYLGTDGTNLIWGEMGKVSVLPMAGGAKVTYGSGGAPYTFASDGTYLYWVDRPGPITSVHRQLLSAPNPGGDALVFQEPSTAPGAQISLHSIEAFNGDFYATEGIGGRLLSCSGASCATATVAWDGTTGGGFPVAHQTTRIGNQIYWAVAAVTVTLGGAEPTSTGGIYRCDLPGCTNLLQLARAEDTVQGIAADAQYVYWGTQTQNPQSGNMGATTGEIRRVPR